MSRADGKVFATKGFPRPRTVAVLREELYYNEQFESFKVLLINFPLLGKVPLDYYKSVTDASQRSTPVERRSLEEHTHLLSSVLGPSSGGSGAPSPLDVAISGMQRFVSTFNSSYVMVKGFIAHTGTKVNSSLHFAALAALA